MKAKYSTPDQTKSTTIDWGKIKNKMAAMQEVIDHHESMPLEENRFLLKKRAYILAAPDKNDTESEGCIEIIVFRLAHETYGIESSFVREVYPLKAITTLPGTPIFVSGIMNVRGQIVSVIDLKKFFHLPDKGLGELNKVIILNNERMEFGILADIVEGTRTVAPKDILTVPSAAVVIGEKYLKGVTKEHIVILDAESILNDESIIVNEIVKMNSNDKR
ncbi:MAG: chemotaxis protein CheW [Bacteroidota bacterium]